MSASLKSQAGTKEPCQHGASVSGLLTVSKSTGHTAAGFPAKGFVAKASTVYTLICLVELAMATDVFSVCSVFVRVFDPSNRERGRVCVINKPG